MESGFVLAAIVCMILNLTLPEELEDTPAQEIPAEKEIEDGKAADSEEIQPLEDDKIKGGEKLA